jgi:hypothetical protein
VLVLEFLEPLDMTPYATFDVRASDDLAARAAREVRPLKAALGQ